MQRLSGLDATFLYLETPANHMHVASTCIFDPSTVPGGYSFEGVRALVADRLPLLPPFRQRLVEVPFGIHHPLWINDPDFDLDYHLRRAALPAPGGVKELADFAAEVHSRPLDRSRPLWEMYVVEGLENGMIATVTKTHHAAIDGVSGAELTVNLLDLQPEPSQVPAELHEQWKPDREPSDVELVLHAVDSLVRQPVRLVKAARRTAELAWGLRKRNRQPGVNPPPAPFSAPRTSLNTAITGQRRLAFAQIALDDVKQVKNALGGTVNDVVLAVCSGALRQYLDDNHERPEKSLIAMVPVSVRTEEQKGTMGNRVSSMLVSLATDLDDPVERLHAISQGTQHAKDQERAIGAEFLTDWTEFAAPAVAARAARLYSSMRLADRHNPFFNVTISNVPGPAFPLYSAGARMLAMYPMGPVADGGGLNITVMSYMGQMFFGLVACRETVPEVWNIAHYINDSLEGLKKAADRAADPKGAPGKAAAKPAGKGLAKRGSKGSAKTGASARSAKSP
jgi:WS/DGAT/MGAT family acyltransferase